MAASTPSGMENLSNPYFLSANENPALVLVSPPLNGANYHTWARAMRMSLISKNKLKFIDGSIEKPIESDNLFPAWERCNMIVLAWITHSISPTIAQSILWIDTARDAWKDLEARFSQGDSFRISDLYDEISSYKQDGDLAASAVFYLMVHSVLIQTQERVTKTLGFSRYKTLEIYN